MNPVDPGDLEDLRDDLQGDRDPLLFGVLGILHPLHYLVGDEDPGHIVPHVAGHTGRLGGYDPGEDVDPLIEPLIPYQLHEPLEPGEVEDRLGLDEVRSGLYLLPQPDDPELEGVSEWIRGRTDEQGDLPADLVPREELPLIPHLLQCLDELDRVEVPDTLGLGMVPQPGMISREAEDILDP